jgi:dihydroorotate dehydrogenase
VERAKRRGVLGINIGKNKLTPNNLAVQDYLHCMERVYPLADYITANISSPNTAGLRDLQAEDALRRFIGELRERQEKLAAQHGKRTPLLVKIAPDLSESEIDGIAMVLGEARIDGVLATNTTVDRYSIRNHPRSVEEGGLSGQPLYGKSTAVLRRLRSRLDEGIPLIGVGGIMSGADAAGKLAAGANLVQFYTGLIYRGPALIRESVEALRLRRYNVTQR